MSKNKKISITLKEFDFLRRYIDIASPTFGNAYQSALKIGYSKSYCRVIRRNYPLWRMKWLKMALKDDGLVRMIEATRNLDFGEPIADMKKIKKIIRKREHELIGMTAEEVTRELDELLGPPV
jgi:murein L,D-transpeptidase YcbB/YkuD